MLTPFLKAFSALITSPFAISPAASEKDASETLGQTVHGLVSHSHCYQCHPTHHIHAPSNGTWHPDLISSDSESESSPEQQPRQLSHVPSRLPTHSRGSHAKTLRCLPIRPFSSSRQHPRHSKDRCTRCEKLELEIEDLRKQVWTLTAEVATVRGITSVPPGLLAVPSRTPAKRRRDEDEDEDDTMLWAPKKKSAWSRTYPASPDPSSYSSTSSHLHREPISPILWDQDGSSESRLFIPRSHHKSKPKKQSVSVAHAERGSISGSSRAPHSPSPYRSAAPLVITLPLCDDCGNKEENLFDVFGPAMTVEEEEEVDELMDTEHKTPTSALWSA
jgi:hypothetical protein